MQLPPMAGKTQKNPACPASCNAGAGGNRFLFCFRVSDEVVEQTVRTEPARTGKLHAKMQVFVAFGPGVGLQDHRNAQPVALGEGHLHDLAHIALPLIRLPHADQTDEDVWLLFPIQPLVQPRAALRHEKSGQRLTLPVHTDIYGFTHYHEPATLPRWLQTLRRLPLLHHLGCRVVRGWELEKKTTTISPDGGNLVTLGGVDSRGINAEQHDPVSMMRDAATPWNVHYFNSNLVNVLKVLLGFIPAQWAFWYVDSWWILTWIGALLWFAITAVRNVLQSMVGGGAFCRSMLLPWNRYVSWSRMADSLLYTGISVPLLEVVVRMWLLEDWLGITVQNNELAVYTVIAMINSVYISGHNIFRGLPKEAVVGNLFRSAISIPLSIVLGKGLLVCFVWLGIADPVGALQNCAAIVSKCSSDIVAAVIEGFADRNMYLRMRTLEYDSKFSQIFNNLVKLALLFPQATIRRLMQEQPREFWQQLLEKDPNAARQAIVHLLDLMYMWYYLPRSHDIFWRRLSGMPTEEVEGILALHSLLRLQREISSQVLDGLLGDNFANALAFYLRQHDSYRKEIRSEAARRNLFTEKAA